MSNIDAFRAGLKLIGTAMTRSVQKGILDEANALAEKMRQRALAHKKSGATVASIQVVQGTNPNRVRIVAGGDLTTKEIRKGSGVPYDYVRAEEFGTKDEPAIPFFYNTYRAEKGGIVRRVTDGAAQALD